MKKIIFNILIIIGLASCQKESINLSTNAKDHFFIKHKGASMPVDVFGNTASKTILVYIAGGPGLSGINYRVGNMPDIEEKYGVAYVNSRACGQSQGTSTQELTASLMTEDLVIILNTIKQRYGQDASLFLVGHSFGAKLITDFVTTNNNQNLVKGWVNLSGWTIDEDKNHQYIRDQYLKIGNQEVAAGKNVDKWKPILDICNANASYIDEETFSKLPSFSEGENLVSKYIAEGEEGIGISQLIENGKSITASLSNLASILTINRKLYLELAAKDYHPLLNKVTIPSLFLVGKYDFLVSDALMQDAYNKTAATEKKLVIFEKSGHQLYSNESALFVKEVMDFMAKYK